MSIGIGKNEFMVIFCLILGGCSNDLGIDHLQARFSDEIRSYEVCLPYNVRLLSERLADITHAVHGLLRTKKCDKDDVVELLGIDRAKWVNVVLQVPHESVYDFPKSGMPLAQIRVWFDCFGRVMAVFPLTTFGMNITKAEIKRLSSFSKQIRNAQYFAAESPCYGKDDICDAIIRLQFEIEAMKFHCNLSMDDILGIMGAPTFCYFSWTSENNGLCWFDGDGVLGVGGVGCLRIVYLYCSKDRPVRVAFTMRTDGLPCEISVQEGDEIFPDWYFADPLTRPNSGSLLGGYRRTL